MGVATPQMRGPPIKARGAIKARAPIKARSPPFHLLHGTALGVVDTRSSVGHSICDCGWKK